MSVFENPENLKLLQNLLNPQESNEDNSDLEDDEGECLIRNKINPGSIGPQTSKSFGKNPNKKSPYDPADTNENLEKQPLNIEEWQERQEQEDREILDTRKTPSYTLAYRQAVGTEDVFLQMGNRTDSSASCEDLVVDILLPDDDTPSDKMHLTIKENEVILSTPIHHLKLPLMHKINVDRCRAQYKSDQHKLTLILRLQRELDFVNF
ncbi:dynein axonemal assembly factor 6 [Cochliomyia hominivorax]